MNELYEFPAGWSIEKLDNIKVSNTIGLVRSQKEQDSSFKYKYIKMNNISNDNRLIFDKITNVNASYSEIEKFQVNKGDFLFNTRNSFELVGKSCIFNIDTKETILYNNNIMRIRFLNRINPYFISYQFSSNFILNQLDHIKSGTTNVSAIYYKTLKKIDILVPPLKEQKRIVSKLDTLFEKIDKAIVLHEKNIKEADAFMGSVLNEVFEDLEKNNSLIKINNIVLKTNNKNTKENEDMNYTYIDISSIDNKLFKIVEPKVVLGKEAPSRAKKEVFIGDIVYSTTRPNLKNIAIIEKEYDNPIASTGFCILRVNNKNEKKFLFYYLLTNKLFEQIEPNIRGAQYPATSDKDLKNCNIPNVLLKTQQKTVNYLDKVSQKIEKTKAIQKEKLQNLKDLKSSILDQAFRGEL